MSVVDELVTIDPVSADRSPNASSGWAPLHADVRQGFSR